MQPRVGNTPLSFQVDTESYKVSFNDDDERILCACYRRSGKPQGLASNSHWAISTWFSLCSSMNVPWLGRLAMNYFTMQVKAPPVQTLYLQLWTLKPLNCQFTCMNQGTPGRAKTLCSQKPFKTRYANFPLSKAGLLEALKQIQTMFHTLLKSNLIQPCLSP